MLCKVLYYLKSQYHVPGIGSLFQEVPLGQRAGCRNGEICELQHLDEVSGGVEREQS